MRLTRAHYLLFLLWLPLNLSGQTAEDVWVEQTLNTLTLDQRIGQLFTIRAHSDLGADHVEEVERQIKTYHVGGVCFFQGEADKHLSLINRYQSMSEIPMLVSMDAEWGIGMRIKKGVIDLPRALMLGAIQDNSLIYEYGQVVAKQLHRLGVHLNFAPVVDVNNNANNPVINFRSFGEDKYNVTTKGYMYMRGMQDHQVAACVKHFPGHGDTDVDSHYDLPVISHDLDRLEDLELFPFHTLVDQNVASVMVAHLNVPTLDERGLPTTLSDKVINGLLRKKMGYNGLVFTDALEMQAVAKNYENGEVELKALQAGNDVLLLPNDIDKAFATIKDHVESGDLHTERINESVRRILRAKYRVGLHQYQAADPHRLKSHLNDPSVLGFKHRLIENALTLVRNDDALIPILEPAHSTASLAIGTKMFSHFQVMIDEYDDIPRYIGSHSMKEAETKILLDKLAKYDNVIVSLHDMSQYASKEFGLSQTVRHFIDALNEQCNVVLFVFGNPYSLKYFDKVDNMVVCYDDARLTQNIAAQALFGAVGFKGRLPVTASPRSTYGSGLDTKSSYRIGYSVPARVGMSMDSLRQVDRLIYELIDKKAAPGAQLLVAKDGHVVYQKEYGYHTYDRKRPVQRDHVYDLASVTKTTATTLAVMKLVDQGKLSIYEPIVKYLPELKGSNKAQMTLQEIMTHQAGLKPWIPFYKATLTSSNQTPSPDYYAEEPSEGYSVKVQDDLYLRTDYKDTIWQLIVDSELRTSKSYRYSDLGFYMIAHLVQDLTGMPLDQYVKKEFYEPLHMSNTTYNPLRKIRRDDIVPTEQDNYFRHAALQGYVHDMGAAMLDGVSGHAGLFSNASDLAKAYQMLLNRGYYGGRQYVKESTIKSFTSRHLGSTRRGVGFDMRELNPDKTPNICRYSSDKTFGHFGFTGTCVWVDPEYKLVYIFLCNRTYPTMTNNLLHEEDYRTRIQEAIYRAFIPSFVQDQS